MTRRRAYNLIFKEADEYFIISRLTWIKQREYHLNNQNYKTFKMRFCLSHNIPEHMQVFISQCVPNTIYS